ncbi:adult-specific rigid cuticular protein 15.7-like isoform X1 [Parasteatoda tepidariorum]|uniref:adult-specific rigid cuticular protein 15.7-like isoform X1 n=1 Tax=Parasteatoda tepidariorum TaxID=114398 RepID=UPI001C722CB0|nr:adult-specific rigid cuticular protein 15.7-like [Parasteatoda tepidariorum]
MITVLVLLSQAVFGQSTPVVYKPSPFYVQPAQFKYVAPVVVKESKPYSFGYNAPAIGGGSSRQETSDGSGRVVGSYTVTDADGRARIVDYYADETGFHANVQTNEPGTANQNPADVSVQSYAAPAVSPVVSPKIIAAPSIVAPAPIYRAPIRNIARRVFAPVPVSYGYLPAYNTLQYEPVTYGSYYSPYKLSYYK